MKTITHREMRNNSSEILRQLEAGESFEVTNRGKVVGTLEPRSDDPFRGLPVRRATKRLDLGKIQPIDSDLTSQEILDIVREERL